VPEESGLQVRGVRVYGGEQKGRLQMRQVRVRQKSRMQQGNGVFSAGLLQEIAVRLAEAKGAGREKRTALFHFQQR